MPVSHDWSRRPRLRQSPVVAWLIFGVTGVCSCGPSQTIGGFAWQNDDWLQMREHSSWGDVQYRFMNHAGRSHRLDWYFAHLGGLRQANASHTEHSVCRYAGGRPSHHRTTAVGLLKMCAKHEYIYYIWLRKTPVFRDMHTFIYAMSCVVLSVCIHDDVRLCVVKFTCFQSYSILQRASVVCHCGKLVVTSKLYWFTSQFLFTISHDYCGALQNDVESFEALTIEPMNSGPLAASSAEAACLVNPWGPHIWWVYSGFAWISNRLICWQNLGVSRFKKHTRVWHYFCMFWIYHNISPDQFFVDL